MAMIYFLLAILNGFAAFFNFNLDHPANWVAGAVCAFIGFLSLLMAVSKLERT
jgi:hypothetical protein